MDGASTLVAIVFAAAVAAFLLSGLGMLVNLVSLVRWRRPSEFGLRLMLATPGLGMMLGSTAIFVIWLTYPEFALAFPWAASAFAFVFGALFFVGGMRVRVTVARPLVPAAPAAGRSAWLFVIYLVPVSALAMWGVLTTTPSHIRTSVVAVSLAATMALFGVYVFARATRLPSRLRIGSLEGPSLFLASAVLSLISTLLLMTLNLPE